MAEGGQKLLKWLMFSFNLLFWVSGIGLIIAGALAQTVYNPYIKFLDSTYYAAPVVLIVVGAVIAIIAFFGCCGSSKENYCMLMTFAVLLGIIFCVELAGGIAAYVERGRVNGYLTRHMSDNLRNYNTTNTTETTAAWDSVQTNFGCCGMMSYNDWINNSTLKKVPVSCCNRTADVSCTWTNDDLGNSCRVLAADKVCPVYNVGCEKKLEEKFISTIGIIGGVGVGVAFLQVVGIAFACILARRIKRGYSY